MKYLANIAFALATLVSVAAAVPQPTTSGGAAMTPPPQAFLVSLDDKTLPKATMAFDDPARLDWHNIPKDQRKGLQVRDMSPKQRELAMNLLRAALSETGYDK